MTNSSLSVEVITLNLRNPFRLSYGTSETRKACVLRLAGDAGWGEGTIPPYYGVSLEEMQTFWEKTGYRSDPWPDDVEEIESWVGKDGPAPARCAVDLALHDRIGRQRGLPLYQLLDLPKPEPKATSFTIAIDTPEGMARLATEIPNYAIIKVKLGSDNDEARLEAIRKVRPDARLRVDANAGWTRDDAAGHVRRLEEFDLEMIEQPLDKKDYEGLGLVQKMTPIPIVADESVQTMEDVERLAAAGVKGINLKLMKVGGLSAGVKMALRARELGLKIMLGCMIETSVGITAMAHLIGLADWLDLDSSLLITNDPFDGLEYDLHANITIPDRPGIGVVLK